MRGFRRAVVTVVLVEVASSGRHRVEGRLGLHGG